jgi:hypothetical protein
MMTIKELPQTLLGVLVIRVTKARMLKTFKDREVWQHEKNLNAVSLGKKIIVPKNHNDRVISHEYGHCLQSVKYGWAYLIIVCLPSVMRNIWDTAAHKKWPKEQRSAWYYGAWPEKQADELGRVDRKIEGARE